MALELNKEIEDTGLVVSGLYAKVSHISIQNKTTLVFSVEYFNDKTKDSLMLNSYNSSYNIEGDNPIKQAYTHLKTLPEFADAVDV
jgi:hypothetical protein